MKRILLYVLLACLALFASAALVKHFTTLPERASFSFREASLPFTYNKQVEAVRDGAAGSGIEIGDKIESLNGRPLRTEQDWARLSELRSGEPVTLEMVRGTGDETTRFTTTVIAEPYRLAVRDYFSVISGYLYAYLIPTVSVFLAFLVAFLRPFDRLAWILILVLLGMSSLSFEGYPENTLVGTYRSIFFASWALGMLLFGIYFPERLPLDKRYPWLKYILVIPLSLQVLLTLLSVSKPAFSFNPVDLVRPLATYYGYIGFYVNMVAIGLFFMMLGYKSGTLENPDSRRRLKLLVWGTGVAMTPTFLIILYKQIAGIPGSFFEAVPFWIAIFAILALNLFPLTLAYVIVVQQAMDVKVVVRQGIQYGLAKGGVRLLQFLLLVTIGLIVRWTIQNWGASFGAQMAFIIGGIAILPLVDYAARPLRDFIDRRFFRDAYDAEQILLELSDDVRTIVETKPLLETVSSRIRESLHVPQITLLVKNGDGFRPAFTSGFDVPPRAELAEGSRAIKTLRRDQHILIYDEYRETTSTPTITLDERRQIEELNSQLLLPMAVKGDLTGVLSLSAKRSEEPYSNTDIRLLRTVASQTGLALENSRLTEAFAAEAAQKERINREVEIAREVQERLFPQDLPKVDGLEYCGGCRPALGVGGDYYDFLELADGRFCFAIGDVSGKGIGAALMMASLQASLRGQAMHSGGDLAALMSNVNSLIYETSTTNRYATFFYAEYDRSSRTLNYVNAGHNPPFLIRKNGEVAKLEDGGPVIGMLPPMLVNYTQGTAELREGDMLLGFTDGISEAMNPKEEEWGEDALLEFALSNRHLKPDELLSAVVAAADKFADGAAQHDDMTAIIVKAVSSAS